MLSSKKALSFLLALLVLLAIAGCAGAEKPSGTPVPAMVTPESGMLGVPPDDVAVTLNPGSYTLKQIVWSNGSIGRDDKPFSQTLAETTDYQKSGDTFTFQKDFLAQMSMGDNYLTFEMSGGENPVFTLSVSGYGGGAQG
ncbi:hypothetical protein FACS1894191_0900 [Clostridia bacterium]|nr:hypothetical protein FACS1894191_0900 [Clostridia bacterium]